MEKAIEAINELKAQAEITLKHSTGDTMTQQAAIIWTCDVLLAKLTV
jgi:hypothetical protein